MTIKNLSETIQKQRDFFFTQKTKDIAFRFEMLKKLEHSINKYEDKIIQALHDDLKKSPYEAYMTEIGMVKEELSFHLKHLKSWAKPKRVKTPILHFISSSFIYPEAYGVVLIIAPWNYPFNLLFTPLIGAISAGNCVVLKPSIHSPHTSTLIEELITNTFREEHISIFMDEERLNQTLKKDKFDYIFYSGNSAFGKKIMEAASKHLTPVTLELGGKSPCIVDREANIDYSARRIAWGKFLNAGQSCVAPDYVFVDKEIKNKVIETLQKYIKIFYGENPEENPDFSRIINDKHFKRLCGLMQKGTILTGGETKKETRYISPTIIDDINPEDPIMQEEIFGPLLPVLEYNTLDEAISFINSRPKPLALYFFSQSRKKQKMVLNQTSFGGGCINDTIMHIAGSYLPFGGIENSGMGAYHGKATFDIFSHKKSILKKSNVLDVKLRYPPYKRKMKLLRRFMK